MDESLLTELLFLVLTELRNKELTRVLKNIDTVSLFDLLIRHEPIRTKVDMNEIVDSFVQRERYDFFDVLIPRYLDNILYAIAKNERGYDRIEAYMTHDRLQRISKLALDLDSRRTLEWLQRKFNHVDVEGVIQKDYVSIVIHAQVPDAVAIKLAVRHNAHKILSYVLTKEHTMPEDIKVDINRYADKYTKTIIKQSHPDLVPAWSIFRILS